MWQRLTSPSSYPCSLCKVTYGAGGMDKRWRSYVAGLDLPTVFLHRDEFRGAYPAESARALPVVLLEEDSTLITLVTATRLQETANLDALMSDIDESLRRAGGHG